MPDFQHGSDLELVAAALLAGLLVASVLVVFGLLARRQWAWVLAIVSSGVILAVDLGWWSAGEPRYASMLLNVIAVFYLNQRDVQLALRGAGDDDVSDPSDLDLLRRHEPILRFTDGELFFPMSTAPYVQACDLLDRPHVARGADRDPGRRARPRRPRGRRGPGARGGPVPAVRAGAAQRPRAPALAVAPGAPAVLGAGTSRARGARRPARRRRPRHLVAAAWPSPGRHGRGSLGALRRDPRRRTLGWSITAASSARTAGWSCTTCSSTR